ncbi:MAG: CHASE2 domain-containing protein, partial [Desulfobacteraceae bacterium]
MIKKELYIDSIVGALFLFLFIGLSHFSMPIFEAMDRNIFDLGRHLPFSSGGTDRPKVTLIEIDDPSLLKFGPLPWSRQMIADAIDKLQHDNAKIIALNIPLADPPHPPGLKDLEDLHEKIKVYSSGKEEEQAVSWILEDIKRIEDKFDANQKLTKSIQNSGNVILAVYRKNDRLPNSISNSEESFLNDNLMVRSQLTPDNFKNIPNVEKLVFPPAEIMQPAAGMGFADSLFGRWGYRSHPLFYRYRNFFLPGLPFRVYLAYLNKKPDQTIVEEDHIKIGDRFLPTYKGELLIKKTFPSKKILRTYSMVDLFEGKINPEFIKDQVILIGLNTYDRRPLIYSHNDEIHANQWMAGVIDDMIHNAFISRPTFLVYLETTLLILLAFWAVFIFARWNSLRRLAAMAGLIILIIVISLVLSAYGSLLLKTSLLTGCVFMIYMTIFIRQFFNFYHQQDETVETSRLLALSLQSQGHLDQAFERFKKLPPDSETKD